MRILGNEWDRGHTPSATVFFYVLQGKLWSLKEAVHLFKLLIFYCEHHWSEYLFIN